MTACTRSPVALSHANILLHSTAYISRHAPHRRSGFEWRRPSRQTPPRKGLRRYLRATPNASALLERLQQLTVDDAGGGEAEPLAGGCGDAGDPGPRRKRMRPGVGGCDAGGGAPGLGGGVPLGHAWRPGNCAVCAKGARLGCGTDLACAGCIKWQQVMIDAEVLEQKLEQQLAGTGPWALLARLQQLTADGADGHEAGPLAGGCGGAGQPSKRQREVADLLEQHQLAVDQLLLERLQQLMAGGTDGGAPRLGGPNTPASQVRRPACCS